GLYDVERLSAPDLSDDDAVGAHAERCPEEIANADGPLALGVGRPRLELYDVRFLELHLARILDDDDAIAVGNEARQRVQHRRLAAASAAGDHDVELRHHHHLERSRGHAGERPELHEALHG